MLKIIVCILIILPALSHEILADELGFATEKEEIVRGLTRSWPKQTVRTRSLSPKVRTRRIEVMAIKDGKGVKEEIVVVENEPIPSVNLKIEFDYNSYQIRSGSYRLLNELGEALKSKALKEKRIIIKGHTDSDGSDAYNLKLSLNRASSVKNYLVGSFSIADNQLRVVGFGEAVPLVPNITPANKQLNRRVEVQAE